jgi:hypothetical protein
VLLGHSRCFEGISETNNPMTMCHIPQDLNPSKSVLFNQNSTINSYLYDMSA